MEEGKTRSIDELADLPYSEMTEEEIELMVEFRATIKARDTAYTEAMNALRAHNNEMIEIAQKESEAAKSALKKLVEQANTFYENASVNNG